MNREIRSASYRLIAELFLHPKDRDQEKIQTLLAELEPAPEGIREDISRFMDDPMTSSTDEYVQTLELSPPCPLYLGTYLFDEPTTCRGVGTSGRNAYMLELTGCYNHFGFQLSKGELPDFLPILIDFLWISLAHPEQDPIGLRRHFLEQYVLPGLKPFREKLAKYESPYRLLVSALEATVEDDQLEMGDEPAWQRPPEKPRQEFQNLPCMSGLECSMSPPGTPMHQTEVRQ